MSAINVIKTSSAVHMITDGMMWNERDKKKSWEQSKVFIAPNLNLCLAVSGNCMFADLFGTIFVRHAKTYDELKANVGELASSAMVESGDYIARVLNPGYILYVAGISETAGPDAYCYSDNTLIGEPRKVHDIVGVGLCPSSEAVMEEFKYDFQGVKDPELMDPEVDGLKILEIQRKWSGGKIGAFAQRTTVTRDGIETRVFHRFE